VISKTRFDCIGATPFSIAPRLAPKASIRPRPSPKLRRCWSNAESDAPALIGAALSAGKLFPSHVVGIGDQDVDAYAAVGASSCHESVTPDQIVLKLRRGLKPWLRHLAPRTALHAVVLATAGAAFLAIRPKATG